MTNENRHIYYTCPLRFTTRFFSSQKAFIKKKQRHLCLKYSMRYFSHVITHSPCICIDAMMHKNSKRDRNSSRNRDAKGQVHNLRTLQIRSRKAIKSHRQQEAINHMENERVVLSSFRSHNRYIISVKNKIFLIPHRSKASRVILYMR